MAVARLKPEEAAPIIDEWTRTVNILADDVESWARERGWMVKRSEEEIREVSIGHYVAPTLAILPPDREGFNLVLQPAARDAYQSQGRVDLYAYPTMYRVTLERRTLDSPWVVWTDSGIAWPNPWNQETFFDLAERLLAAR